MGSCAIQRDIMGHIGLVDIDSAYLADMCQTVQEILIEPSDRTLQVVHSTCIGSVPHSSGQCWLGFCRVPEVCERHKQTVGHSKPPNAPARIARRVQLALTLKGQSEREITKAMSQKARTLPAPANHCIFPCPKSKIQSTATKKQ